MHPIRAPVRSNIWLSKNVSNLKQVFPMGETMTHDIDVFPVLRSFMNNITNCNEGVTFHFQINNFENITLYVFLKVHITDYPIYSFDLIIIFLGSCQRGVYKPFKFVSRRINLTCLVWVLSPFLSSLLLVCQFCLGSLHLSN